MKSSTFTDFTNKLLKVITRPVLHGPSNFKPKPSGVLGKLKRENQKNKLLTNTSVWSRLCSPSTVLKNTSLDSDLFIINIS
jgi:hypothetical protein